MEDEVKYFTNKNFKKGMTPYFTIITPFYNRAYCANRVFQSVENQTFRDFEYIIVDDGSTDNLDEIVQEFMDNTKIPIMYIKKTNGGVHTARNIGIRNGRGKLLICLDSDDELTPNALKYSKDEWEGIPIEERKEHFQMKGLCKHENGKLASNKFPGNINELEWHERVKIARANKGEQIGVRVLKIMKDNPWPEPKDVTFVTENVLWSKLDKKYKSHYFNKILRIYHTENEDHISNINNNIEHAYSMQKLKNNMWVTVYYINNSDIYIYGKIGLIKIIIQYSVYKNILSKKEIEFVKMYPLEKHKVLYFLLYLPSKFVAILFKKKRNIS